LLIELYDKNDLLINDTKYEITNSNTTTSSIKNSKGKYSITVNNDGISNIKIVALDNTKESVSFDIIAKDFTPTLVNNTITINKALEDPCDYIQVYEMYDTEIENVNVLNPNTQEISSLFTCDYGDGLIKITPTIDALSLKSSSFILSIKLNNISRIYKYKINAKITEQYPNVLISTSGKIDTFDLSKSDAKLVIDNKGYALEEISSLDFGNAHFYNNGTISNLKKVNNKFVTKGKIKLKYEGYKEFEKNISFGTTTASKPKYKLSTTSINLATSSIDFAIQILDSKNNVVDLSDYTISSTSLNYINPSYSNGYICFDELPNTLVNETFNIVLDNSNWNESISFKLKVVVKEITSKNKPTITIPTIVLNKYFEKNGSTIINTIYSGIDVIGGDIINNNNINTNQLNVSYDNETVFANILDSNIKVGTYKYKLSNLYVDGTKLNDVIIQIKASCKLIAE